MKFSPATTRPIDSLVAELETDLSRGLASTEASKRLALYGTNDLEAKQTLWWRILVRQFSSPFVYLLVAAGIFSLILRERLEGITIFVFVFINAFLGFYQEYHSERTLRLLKKYVSSKVQTRRDGKLLVISVGELVPGDVVLVKPGDIIPADLRIAEDHDLVVDESVLTGESVPVRKSSSTLAAKASEPFQASNIAFKGTSVISGEGAGIVVATGTQTVMGDISHLAAETERASTFEKEINKISKFILALIVVMLVFFFAANILVKSDGLNVVELIIFTIVLAVSVIPEALPLVITFSLSRSAAKLAKDHVVVKRLSAIEDLGSFEVLCTDKTGTLTENSLTVVDVWGESQDEVLVHAAGVGSFSEEGKAGHKNPFDVALWSRLAEPLKGVAMQYVLIGEVPFDPDRRYSITLLQKGSNRELVIRGAPDEVVQQCLPMKEDAATALHSWIAAQGYEGRRVLAIASKPTHAQSVKDAAAETTRASLLGVVSFEDPLKPSTAAAVEKARELGVQVKILTGDSPEVAGAVAHRIGLIASPHDVVTGTSLAEMTETRQREAVMTNHVFARVTPRQKYEIIALLQEKVEVGFLGEGINDAPALKIANVAMVVEGASDIAKETSDIILLNKSLQVIVDGIQSGRVVFANTAKYIKATLASNLGNFFAVGTASLLVDFLPMLPLQILLVNLLSDFPMIAISTDTVDREELKIPRHYNVKEIALVATFLGLTSTAFDFLFFALFYRMSPEILQTNWFIGSILTELLLLFSIRTKFAFFKARKPSSTLFWLTLGAFVLTILIPFTAFGQKTFHFLRPTTEHTLLILGIVLVYFFTTEIVKLLFYRFAGQYTAVQKLPASR